LIRKTIRQPVPSRSPSTSAPPTIGPQTAARPMTGPNRLNAFGSSSGGKTALMIPKPCGIRIAANAPCSSREATSMPGEAAMPHRTLAATKPAEPIRNNRRRP
jgi:hypothetical protein